TPHVTLEMSVIDGVEADECAEEPPVGLHDPAAKKIAALRKTRFHLIESGEELTTRLLVRLLDRGEAGLVNAVVHILVDEAGKSRMLLVDVPGKQIGLAGAERAEGV